MAAGLLAGIYEASQFPDHSPHLPSLRLRLGRVAPRPVGTVALASRPTALSTRSRQPGLPPHCWLAARVLGPSSGNQALPGFHCARKPLRRCWLSPIPSRRRSRPARHISGFGFGTCISAGHWSVPQGHYNRARQGNALKTGSDTAPRHSHEDHGDNIGPKHRQRQSGTPREQPSGPPGPVDGASLADVERLFPWKILYILGGISVRRTEPNGSRSAGFRPTQATGQLAMSRSGQALLGFGPAVGLRCVARSQTQRG
jgi:hypothetical protein